MDLQKRFGAIAAVKGVLFEAAPAGGVGLLAFRPRASG